MLIYTARVRWKDLSAVLALTAAFALCLIGGQLEPAAVTAAALARTESDRAAYLAGLGWEVTGLPTTEEVALPETFGTEYEEYLALQTAGGFDLLPYAGQTVTRYSYPIGNYPTGTDTVFADLLVLEGEIIGGELRSAELDGFMAPLTAREEG